MTPESTQDPNPPNQPIVDRFQIVTDKDIDELRENAKNQNTKSATDSHMRTFTAWQSACTDPPHYPLESYDEADINHMLQKFIIAARKEDGEPYN